MTIKQQGGIFGRNPSFNDLDVEGNLTVDSGTLYVDSTNNRVGVGTSSPAESLHLEASSPVLRFSSSDDGNYHHLFSSSDDFYISADRNNSGSGNLIFRNGGTTEVARFNSSGDFNVKGGAGIIGITATDQFYISRNAGSQGIKFKNGGAIPCNNDGSDSDNDQDLGVSSVRWDDVYATNGTIQTSDRNEKQDIDVLSDAERNVAVAAKGLLRKFRWIDAVTEKGDAARIHFGIIAQDLQDAFAAEGLDAGRYAMFTSSTWWETQTDVPAVEAVAEVLDEEGNVVTEAVEAKEAYTRTDTYETLEEAPEGATERTRLGVRYSELLAFIVSAI